MVKKTNKKVDVKKVAKLDLSKKLVEFLTEQGLEVLDGADFGFTEGTVVVRGEVCDIQVKLITPKAGLQRYEPVVEVEE